MQYIADGTMVPSYEEPLLMDLRLIVVVPVDLVPVSSSRVNHPPNVGHPGTGHHVESSTSILLTRYQLLTSYHRDHSGRSD